ncbi:MAG: fluoride efflux transporter CrcB [Ruminococcus sp.]
MGVIFVALGGALGSVLRYAISLIPFKTDFPFITLIINFMGAIAIGFVMGVVSEKSPNMLLFWKTGVCGGFTTFSTFSLEAITLFEKKMFFFGGLYVILSIGLCLAGVLCGKKIALLFP